MRLIDAEKVVHEYYKNPSYQQLCKVLNEAPTVKAIPIEWIDGYIKRRANDVNIYAEILFISDMVKEWEKENEQ